MSRIGKMPVSLPKGVQVSVSKGNVVTVKGPKGELSQDVHPNISVEVENGVLRLARPNDQQHYRALHGLYRALISNMVEGVTNGFTLSLELEGVGYRCSNKGQLLELMLGYSHPIMFYLPKEVAVETKMEKGQRPTVILTSTDKQLIGQVAAKIRSFRKPEPYKGKGVRYKGEAIRRKAGKTSGKK